MDRLRRIVGGRTRETLNSIGIDNNSDLTRTSDTVTSRTPLDSNL